MGTDEIVYAHGNYAIVKSIALFGSGFNVYQAPPNSNTFTKINPRMLFFTTFEAALEWLEKFQKSLAGDETASV